MSRKAMFFKSLPQNKVKCYLCPQGCVINKDSSGLCGVRKNINGILKTVNYGRAAAVNLDPVEKKPLYHFFPGTELLSIGCIGCNLKCGFCQNWELARGKIKRDRKLSPESLLDLIKRRNNCIGIAYTYSEPFIWYEFLKDVSCVVSKAGFKNVLVSNGYINQEPLRNLLPSIDAANIDLKAFNDGFYRKYCSGSLQPVLDTISTLSSEIHLEITTLLIPGLNDSRKEIEKLTGWIADLDSSIPLHISRYYPHHKLNKPPTPLKTLIQAREIALEKLDFVYLGNVRNKGTGDTYCPSCGLNVVERSGIGLRSSQLTEDSTCPECDYVLPFLISK